MSSEGAAGPLTDLHSHLVPGVDDGATNLDEALEGLGRMVAAGIGTVVTTPHLEGALTREPAALAERLAEVDRAFEQLVAAAGQQYPGLSVQRGHEVRLDQPDPDLTDQRLRLGDSDVVLVEWPRLLVPPETPAVLRELRSQGVRLLIAHPERYRGYDANLALVEMWRAEGAMLQVNLGSLSNRYGPAPHATALRLLERGWADCLASDFHGRPHLKLYLDEAKEAFETVDAEESFRILTQVNPDRILKGEVPLMVPPVTAARGLLDRLRSLFQGRP